MTKTSQDDLVRTFFDQDSGRYIADRYPAKARSCSQYSYLVRREHVLRLLGHAPSGAHRLLDVGCGPGVYTGDLLRLGWKVTGMDLSPGMLREAKSSYAEADAPPVFLAGNAALLPFESSSFDAVICIGVISYVESLDAALSEIARVLKPSGAAVLQVSNSESMFELAVRVRRWLSKRRRGSASGSDALFEKIRLRPYRAATLRKACRVAGLEPVRGRYYDFSIPVLTRAPRPALWLARRLESLKDTGALAWLGASYLLSVRRAREQ